MGQQTRVSAKQEISRDEFEDDMFEAKAKASGLQGQGQTDLFAVKAKVTVVCPRAVLQVKDNPCGPHP